MRTLVVATVTVVVVALMGGCAGDGESNESDDRQGTGITVDGEANNTNFLQVTVNRPGADHVLSWARVPYDSLP